MITSPIVAARDALAAYLKSGLRGAYPNLETFSKWPTPGERLPDESISVLIAGKPEVEGHEPVIWRTNALTHPADDATPSPGWVDARTLYSFGRAKIPLQLDVWTRYESVRDDLALAVRNLVNQAPGDTLGVASVSRRLSDHPGLVLPLEEVYGIPCEYLFGGLPQPIEDVVPSQSGEYRSTWDGSAFVYLVSEEQVPRMAEVLLRIGDTTY